MAIADINVLLDQAADRAIELRSQVKEASSELEDTLAAAEKAGRVVASETEEVKSAILTLIGRLNQVEDAVAKARGDAADALDDVETTADAAVTDADDLVTAVTDALTQVKASVDQVDQDLTARFGAVVSKAIAVGNAAGAVNQEMGEGKTEAETALKAFGDALETADKDVQTAGENMAAALQSAVVEMGLSADDWTDSLGELLEIQTRALREAANEVIRTHNAAMGALKTALSEEVEKAAGPPVEQLLQALQELHDVASSHQALLTEEVATMLKWINETFRPELAKLSQKLRENQRLQ